MDSNRYGKFSNFEITSVHDTEDEHLPTEIQNIELHTVPNIIVKSEYMQDGKFVFVAKSIIGVITIRTPDVEFARSLRDAMKDNVAINLLRTNRSV